MSQFIDKNPSLDEYWRSIILFGRNVASYKFALAKTLLQFKERGNDLIRMDELAQPFAQNICEHIKHSPKQATSRSSRFLDACTKFNAGELSISDLEAQTVKLGFNNVIDAFHVVNGSPIQSPFYIDERKESGGIRLTDNLFHLLEDKQAGSLNYEVEARWRLVETAWDLNLSKNLIAVQYDAESDLLSAFKNNRRINITSCRDALNGYQKGKCFYCRSYISVDAGSENLADIDHFFPHALKAHNVANPVDGVWNLVLSCKDCNRGEDGKFAKIPSLNLLTRLKQRNDYLIGSHHPLRETLISQTGKTVDERTAFLQSAYSKAKGILIHTWEPKFEHDNKF